VTRASATTRTVRSVRVLVTNDDRVLAPGLHHLACALDERGFDVVVGAPLADRSGSGAAIGPLHIERGLRFQETPLAGLAHVPAYGVDGPPALAVMAACLGGFGPPPELVMSGVNSSANTVPLVRLR